MNAAFRCRNAEFGSGAGSSRWFTFQKLGVIIEDRVPLIDAKSADRID
jgi:hypothetical protein